MSKIGSAKITLLLFNRKKIRFSDTFWGNSCILKYHVSFDSVAVTAQALDFFFSSPPINKSNRCQMFMMFAEYFRRARGSLCVWKPLRSDTNVPVSCRILFFFLLLLKLDLQFLGELTVLSVARTTIWSVCGKLKRRQSWVRSIESPTCFSVRWMDPSINCWSHNAL